MTITLQSSLEPSSMPRTRLSLDGSWGFQLQDDVGPATITVPGPWQARDEDLRHVASGRASYTRQVTVPDDWQGKQVAILFGAVNYFAEVFVNGRRLGEHEGGYLPFEFVIPSDLTNGELHVEVFVTLPSGDCNQYPDFPFDEIPHGKQSWYGHLGGIWQSVWLECRNETHVFSQRIRADLASGSVSIEAQFSQVFSGKVVASIFDRLGQVAAATEVAISSVDSVALSFEIADVLAWSPDDPALYRTVLELHRDGQLLDVSADTFGFRTFETRDGQFYLNGELFYMRGALDQDYYPDGICTPPSLQFLEDQARKAKELGLNLLRCHIKVPDPRYYDVADRFGLLVWTEIPNVQTFTEKSAQRLLGTMSGILQRDGNHPSIVIWTIINEDWGTRLVDSKSQRVWLKQAYHWLKQEDPTRLVVDNSACIPNFHVQSDIDDYHYYAAIPEMAGEWRDWVARLASRPDWTYSPNGDAVRSGNEPLVLSEFGVWGLPDLSKQLRNGKAPFWTETGLDWSNSEGVAYPHGMEDRFRSYRMDELFTSLSAFCEATQWHQFKALKYEIEELRRHASIQGYVVTELTDVHWEANGLMDLDRNPRVYHDRFQEINADIVIIPRSAHHSAWSGSVVDVQLEVATGGSAISKPAALHWSVDGVESQPIAIAATDVGTVRPLGSIAATMPETPDGKVATIAFRLLQNGLVLAENSIEISVLASRRIPPVSIYASDAVICAYLAGLGYKIVGPEQAQVHIVDLLDSSDIEAIEHGASYIALADGVPLPFGNLRKDKPNWNYPKYNDRQQPAPQMAIVERAGSIWQGNWITGFSWVKRTGVFDRLPGGPLIDMAFAGVVPKRVISGSHSLALDGQVQAGMVSGWLHKPAALIARHRMDKGTLIATTFGLLREAPGNDPIAVTLLDCLIETAAARPTAE